MDGCNGSPEHATHRTKPLEDLCLIFSFPHIHSRSQPSLSPGSILAHARAISNTSPPSCCAWATRRRVWPPNGCVGKKKSNINPPKVLSDGWHVQATIATIHQIRVRSKK